MLCEFRSNSFGKEKKTCVLLDDEGKCGGERSESMDRIGEKVRIMGKERSKTAQIRQQISSGGRQIMLSKWILKILYKCSYNKSVNIASLGKGCN